MPQKTGIPVEETSRLVAKELVDNALDAGANCTIEPYGEWGFIVKDDGSGIEGEDETVAELFSFGRSLKSSKLLRTPSRGALGNGLRVVAGAVYCTGGTLIVRTKGRSLKLSLLTLTEQQNHKTLVLMTVSAPKLNSLFQICQLI